MPFEVVDVQPTPNPNAAKFVLNQSISVQSASFFTAEAAKGHAIASKLFAIPGVASLLLLGDFVTVNRQPGVPWETITSEVRKILKKI